MTITDDQARIMIKNNLDVSMLVEAGAGSGKTTCMVDRIVNLIATGRAGLQSIAAVTFSNKAASDLRERFQERLEEELAKTEKGCEAFINLSQALESLEQANIGTIHSFCAKLLRERPVEAYLDPRFEELNNDDNLLLASENWHEFLRNEPAFINTLQELGLTTSDCFDAYMTIAANPDVIFECQPVEKPDLAEIMQKLNGFLDIACSNMPKEFHEKGPCEVQKAVIQAKNLLSDCPDDLAIIDALTLFAKSTLRVTQYKWSSKSIGADMSDTLCRFRDEIAIPRLKDWRAYAYCSILGYLNKAVLNFRKQRSAASKLNFTDLLLLAAKMLRDNPEVREYFRDRYRYILVDEFQDTDPIQTEIIFLLTASDSRESNWRNCNPIQGSLFIVGDPKQSIYRFRRADIELYSETKAMVKKAGGVILYLTKNFRSNNEIIDFVKTAFADRFPTVQSKTQAQAAPMEAVKPTLEMIRSGAFRSQVEYSRYRDCVLEPDSENIAAQIESAIACEFAVQDRDRRGRQTVRACRPSDFMILTPYKPELDIYFQSLKKRGIPARVLGAESFSSNRTLGEVMKVLRFIAEPESKIELLAVLRGLFFGLTEQQLYDHKVNKGQWDISNIESGCSDVIEALRKLQDLYQASRDLGPIEALNHIIDNLGAIPYSASDYTDDDPGALLHVLELFAIHSIKEGLNFPQAVKRLDEELQTDLDSACLMTGHRDSVLITNMHKAKGLEAPVVFLANPRKAITHKPGIHISRDQSEAKGFFMMTAGRMTIAEPPSWDRLSEIENEYLENEKVRFVYVAATRAKQMLIVSCTENSSESGYWGILEQYIDDVSPLLPEHGPQCEKKPIVEPQSVQTLMQELNQLEGKIKQTIGEGNKPSYEDVNVSAYIEHDHYAPVIKGRGAAWGDMVHDILGIIAKYPDTEPDRIINDRFDSGKFSDSDLDELKTQIHHIIDSDFWNRVRSSEHVMIETPFVSFNNTGRRSLLSGQIDLVFKEGEGWALVEYKTDIPEPGKSEELARYYSDELTEYANHWQKCTNQLVSGAYIVLVSTGETFKISQ